jgi:hypothetical protein
MYERRGRIWIPEAPHLALNRTAEAEIGFPAMRVSGHFRVEMGPGLSRGAPPRMDTGWFRNMIVDSGWNYMVGGGGDAGNGHLIWLSGYLEVGTGVTAVAAGQTTLANPIARTTNNGSTGPVISYVAGSPDYWSCVVTRLFTESQAVGAISELGFFAGGTATLGSGTMGNRQRIVDQLGNETVLNKTAEDQLRVTFQLRVYPPQADVAGSVTLTGLGTTHDFTVRGLSVSSSSGLYVALPTTSNHIASTSTTYAARAVESNALVARTAGGGGSSADNASSGTVSAYVAGQFYRDLTWTWEPGVANFAAGVGKVLDWQIGGSVWGFQVAFTQPILKTNTRRLRLTFRRSLAPYP